MAKTLKNIKIIFSVDVNKIKQNVAAVEASINTATKKIEAASKGVSESQDEVVRASERVADAMGEQSRVAKVLLFPLKAVGTTLGFLRGALESVLSGAKLLSLGIVGTTTVLIKLLPTIQQFAPEIQAIGLGLNKLTVGFAILVTGGFNKLATALTLLGPRFVGFQQKTAGIAFFCVFRPIVITHFVST